MSDIHESSPMRHIRITENLRILTVPYGRTAFSTMQRSPHILQRRELVNERLMDLGSARRQIDFSVRTAGTIFHPAEHTI